MSPIIVFFANKWVLSRNTTTQLCCETESHILQGVIDLLPIGDNNNNNNNNNNRGSSKVIIPVGFYFALLSRSLEVEMRSESNEGKLEEQIMALLHLATVQDLLLLLHAPETMESIVSKYVASNSQTRCFKVAELWDSYLFHVVAKNSDMGPHRFMELIERVPASCRQNHDQLYRAINSFLKVCMLLILHFGPLYIMYFSTLPL